MGRRPKPAAPENAVVADAIRAACARKRWTQTDLARAMGEARQRPSDIAPVYTPAMRRTFPALLLALLVSPAALAADFTGRVVSIADGDTLTVLAEGNRQVKVRLWGIDAPESGQPFGSRAKQSASDL